MPNADGKKEGVKACSPKQFVRITIQSNFRFAWTWLRSGSMTLRAFDSFFPDKQILNWIYFSSVSMACSKHEAALNWHRIELHLQLDSSLSSFPLESSSLLPCRPFFDSAYFHRRMTLSPPMVSCWCVWTETWSILSSFFFTSGCLFSVSALEFTAVFFYPPSTMFYVRIRRNWILWLFVVGLRMQHMTNNSQVRYNVRHIGKRHRY